MSKGLSRTSSRVFVSTRNKFIVISAISDSVSSLYHIAISLFVQLTMQLQAQSQGSVTGFSHRVQSQGSVTGFSHRVQSQGSVTGFSHRVQSQGSVTGFSHRVQSQGSVTGFSHRVQSQGSVTGFSHRVQSQGFKQGTLIMCHMTNAALQMVFCCSHLPLGFESPTLHTLATNWVPN